MGEISISVCVCVSCALPATWPTGVLLTILYWATLLDNPVKSAAFQNFLITIEMFFAAILLRFAFPYKIYMDLRKDGQGRGVPVKRITSHFKDTLNPHDVVDDAIHNFSRVYQKYAQQGDMSEDEIELDNSTSRTSDDDSFPVKRGSNGGKRGSDGFERVTLLVESDEDEIL